MSQSRYLLFSSGVLREKGGTPRKVRIEFPGVFGGRSNVSLISILRIMFHPWFHFIPIAVRGPAASG